MTIKICGCAPDEISGAIEEMVKKHREGTVPGYLEDLINFLSDETKEYLRNLL